MARLLRMPSVLANSTEAILQSWLVQVGEPFEIGDDLAEVETEKALVELASEDAGIMGRHLVTDGKSVEVGMPIAVILADGETDADIDALLEGTETDAEQPVERPDDNAGIPVGASPVAAKSTSQRVFVSPLVRRLARDRGVDFAELRGTGPNGRIVRRDLEAWTATKSDAPVAPAAAIAAPTRPASAAYEDTPHTPMRRAIARRLLESKTTIPHFYLTTECRVDRLLALRAEINASLEVKISVNDMIVKAVATAFARVPEANVVWTDRALRRFDHIDIAVAVSTDKGLLTPVVRNVGALSLTAVSESVGDLVSRARSGRLRQDELEGGSFSISNLGMYGVSEFAAIINPPQSGILAIGAAEQRAVVSDGELSTATVMRCTMSVDHRAVDGALAAQWLAAFTSVIEHPVTMLV